MSERFETLGALNFEIVASDGQRRYGDRRNVDPVVSGTPSGAQGRSSWEGGAEGVLRRRRSIGRMPVRKKKTHEDHEVGLFFLVPTSFQ